MAITLQKKGAILLIEGLDVSKPAEFISERASPDNQNFTVHRALLTKRVGTVASGVSLGEEVMIGTEFSREGSNYNIRIGLTKIQRNIAETWTDIGHEDFSGTSDDIFDIAIPLLGGKQILVVTNGIDPMRKWEASGDTAVLGGDPPVAKFIQEYKTYLVGAHILGGTDVDTRVQWSDTANPEEWADGNAGAKDLEEDGGEITGMNIFGNYLCIHKDKSIYLGYLVDTTAVFRFDRKATGAGTCANNSIVNFPTGEQGFLAPDGLRIFNGITATLIDGFINDEIRDSINNEKRHKAFSVLVREQDEAWFFIPTGASTFVCYKFNYVTRVLYKDLRLGASAAWRSGQSTSITWDMAVGTWDTQIERWNSSSFAADFPLIYIGFDNGDVEVVNNSSSDDAGEPILSFWESKDFMEIGPDGAPTGNLLRWQELELYAKGTSIQVEYSTDAGQTWNEMLGSPTTLMDEFPTDYEPLIYYFDVVSSMVRFRFSNNELGGTLFIKQFLAGYLSRERRK